MNLSHLSRLGKALHTFLLLRASKFRAYARKTCETVKIHLIMGINLLVRLAVGYTEAGRLQLLYLEEEVSFVVYLLNCADEQLLH